MAHSKTTGRIGRPPGRKTGQPTIRTLLAAEIMETAGYEPLWEIIRIARNKKAGLDLQLRAAAELASFVYPKRKAMEITEHNTQKMKIELVYVNKPSPGDPSKTIRIPKAITSSIDVQ